MIMEEVVIFGASKLGENAYHILKRKYNIKFYCDNDQSKWGRYINGIEVISPESLLLKGDILVIIASMFSFQITRQLQEMQIKNIKTFQCIDLFKNKYTINDVYSIEQILNINVEELSPETIEKTCDVTNLDKYSNNIKSQKKVLIIAYIFPPFGGSGVQRTLKFVKNLIYFGWQPIILTVGENFCNEKIDISLLSEIPNEVKIIRVDENISNIENMRIDEIREIIRLYLGISERSVISNFIDEYGNNQGIDLLMPDKHIAWVNNVLKEIDNLIDFKEIDLIFSTSAPNSDHILAYNIKRRYNIPWVADFRDEWTNNHIINYDKTKKYYELQFLMEKNVVEAADSIITVSEVSTENYINRFGLKNSKVITITNGYDEGDFDEIGLVSRERNSKFTIVFSGTLYEEAPPYNLLIAIENLVKRSSILSSKVQMIFVGSVSESMRKKINGMNLKFDVVWHGYMPHRESLKIAAEADLLFTNAGSYDKCRASYTGKIFEYLRLCKPILAFSPKESVIEKLLNRLNRGKSVEESDIMGIENVVQYYYKSWMNVEVGILPKSNILEFERKNLTKKLATVFEQLIY